MLVPLQCLYECRHFKRWLPELDGQDLFSLKREPFVHRGDPVCTNDHAWKGGHGRCGNLDMALDAEAIKKRKRTVNPS